MSRTLDRSQGKFEAMPVSDGAPIVESGSNADGYWTRWADGTQQTASRLERDYGNWVDDSNSGFKLASTPVRAIYPVAFIVPPYFFASSTSTYTVLASGGLLVSASQSQEYYLCKGIGGPFSPLGTQSVDISAIGRWK